VRSLIPGICGGDDLVGKPSSVDADGRRRGLLIAGVKFRSTRPVPHEAGHVTEVIRAGWDELDAPVAQVHLTTTLPGRVRGWGIHRVLTDRLFVAQGMLKLVVFDGRENSPTLGLVNEFTLSEMSPGLLVIPPFLYHGWKNIGVNEALLLSMPDKLFDYETPDVLMLPWDSEAAARLIPYQW
jgi:dTDP-4-dehydrorhamnose 3,5-epimerase